MTIQMINIAHGIVFLKWPASDPEQSLQLACHLPCDHVLADYANVNPESRWNCIKYPSDPIMALDSLQILVSRFVFVKTASEGYVGNPSIMYLPNCLERGLLFCAAIQAAKQHVTVEG